MYRKTLTAASALALLAGGASAMGHAGNMGYALANDGMTLVVMQDVAQPDMVMTYELSAQLKGIAWRPVTGELLGISDGMVYTVDPMDGTLTDLGASFMDDATFGEGAAVAFDFNNAIDAVRAVSGTGDNLVYFPEGFGDMDERAGSVRRFTDAFYVEGDRWADQTPNIFANAYTNAINGMTASSTFQYALDAQTNSLVSLANNAGELMTVGLLTIDGEAVDVVPMGGFDIFSPEEGTDVGLAILQIDGEETAGFYQVDLETGALSMLADLGMGGFTGFAVSMPSDM